METNNISTDAAPALSNRVQNSPSDVRYYPINSGNGGNANIVLIFLIIIIAIALSYSKFIKGDNDNGETILDRLNKGIKDIINTSLFNLPGIIDNRSTDPGSNEFIKTSLQSLSSSRANGDVLSVGNRNNIYEAVHMTYLGQRIKCTPSGQSYKVKSGGTIYTDIIFTCEPALKLIRFGLPPIEIRRLERIYSGKAVQAESNLKKEFRGRNWTMTDLLNELRSDNGLGIPLNEVELLEEINNSYRDRWFYSGSPSSWVTDKLGMGEVTWLPILKGDSPKDGFVDHCINISTEKISPLTTSWSDVTQNMIDLFALLGPHCNRTDLLDMMKRARSALGLNPSQTGTISLSVNSSNQWK